MIDPQPIAAGDEGEQVTGLQRRLHFLNYYADEITGRYDDSTVNGVKEFQLAAGREQTGSMSLEDWQQLEYAARDAGFYEPTDDAGEPGGLAVGTLSEDGHYQWDGTEWQPVGGESGGETSGEVLSEDGQYRWDGENWVPVGGEAARTEPVLTEEQFAQMISESISVSGDTSA